MYVVFCTIDRIRPVPGSTVTFEPPASTPAMVVGTYADSAAWPCACRSRSSEVWICSPLVSSVAIRSAAVLPNAGSCSTWSRT